MEQKILDCAEKLFLDKGYALTSTTEIAREVGCNQALVHYYFRTKEKLFQKIFEDKLELFILPFIQLNDDNVSFTDALKAKLNSLFDMLNDNPKLPFMLLNELITNPLQIESLKSKIMDSCGGVFLEFEKSVQKEVSLGRIRPTNAFDITINVLSLAVSFFLLLPIFEGMDLVTEDRVKEFATMRKIEIINTIINSLNVK